MILSRKIIPALLLLFIAACGPKKTVPIESTGGGGERCVTQKSLAQQYSVPGPFKDPELGLRIALDSLRAGNYDAALRYSQRVAEQYPGTVWYKRSLFVSEQALIQLDQASAADAAMLRVCDEYPELADYAVYFLAEYHYSKAEYSQAVALYQVVTEKYPRSIVAVQAAYRRGLVLNASSSYLPAIEAFEEFLEDYPRSDLAPGASIGLARALTADAQLERAVLAYHDVWTRYPGTDADQEAEQALQELKAKGVPGTDFTPAELYERGKNLFRLNQYDKAVEAFTNLLERDPSFSNRADVLFRTGVSLFNLAKRGESAAVLVKMVHDYPDDPRTPEALYWLGKSYSKLGDRDRGVRTFQKVLDRFPGSGWADEALFLTGNIYREAGDMKKALQYYARLMQEYPDSNVADSGIWWMAWSYYTAGDYVKAEQTLQELVSRYPRSFLVNQARYWQGRAAEKRGELAHAMEYYGQVLKKGPFTYYGNRASERKQRLEAIGIVLNADDRTSSEPGAICAKVACAEDPVSSFENDAGSPEWTDETKQVFAATPLFRKTLEMMQLDLKSEAAQELWTLQDTMPNKNGILIGLSKAFFELGEYNRSLLLVLRNYQRYLPAPNKGVTEDLWLLAYPQGYWESILSYARKYEQDPYFIAAIIREESQFSPTALSPAGARGLMQVMPATGERAAQSIKLRDFDRGKLFEIDTAINIGTWYIGQLMKRFNNDPLLVAAAYNAGPEAVASWLAKYGYEGDHEAFVEEIPFAETRGYVKKVLRNYTEYKRIYNKRKVPTESAQTIDHDRAVLKNAGMDDQNP
ncbi:MAG TPA: tetratricopeptide repeat protein [Nitrospirota bacterium]|nr:tetratricopeptide repeat protein [Nitrospirota bacterium]